MPTRPILRKPRTRSAKAGSAADTAARPAAPTTRAMPDVPATEEFAARDDDEMRALEDMRRLERDDAGFDDDDMAADPAER